MSDARTEILARVRSALSEVPAEERPADVSVARDYERTGRLARARVINLFEERIADYQATVRRVGRRDLAAAIAQVCEERSLRRIAVPPRLERRWCPPDLEIIPDRGLSARELDSVDAVLTGCAAAIASTGTVILDGAGRSGRRLLTLVPDTHICIVDAAQIVETVPEALARVQSAVQDQGLPITLISGPSASSDIELSRVEGVHGPRNLIVLVRA